MIRRPLILLALVPALASLLDQTFAASLGEANSLYVLDRFQEARRVYAEVADASGADAPLAAFLMGKCSTRLGRHSDAVSAYERVLDHYPGSEWAARAGIALGDAYVALGKWEEAVAAYRRVAEGFHSFPQQTEARLKMANTLSSPLNDDNADYNAAIENYLYILRHQGDPAQAGIDLAQVYFGMGDAFRRMGRYADAIPYFEQCRSIDPAGVWGAAGQNMIGYCRLAMKQPMAAAQAFRNTADQYPKQSAFVLAANTSLDLLERRGIRAEAERSSVEQKDGRWIRILEGSVTITAEDWSVECRKAQWDPVARVLACFGGVRFQRDGSLLFTAKEIRFTIPPEQPVVLPTPPAVLQQIEAARQAETSPGGVQP